MRWRSPWRMSRCWRARSMSCPDVSGSMGAPVTGFRQGATSQVTCRDAAALIASAILRRNPSAEVIAFDDQVRPLALNPRD